MADKQLSYWEQRAIDEQAKTERISTPYLKQIRRIHEDAQRQTLQDIHYLYETAYNRDKFIFDGTKLSEIIPERDIQEYKRKLKEAGIEGKIPEQYKGRMTRLEAIYAQNEIRLHEVGQQLVDLHTKAFTKVLKQEYDTKVQAYVDANPILKNLELRELNKRGYKHYFPNYNKDINGNHKEWKLDSRYPLNKRELATIYVLNNHHKGRSVFTIIRKVNEPEFINMADLFIDGILTEIKRASSPRTLRDRIASAEKQGAQQIVFDLTDWKTSEYGEYKEALKKALANSKIKNYAVQIGDDIVVDKLKNSLTKAQSRRDKAIYDTLTQSLKYVNPFNSYNQGMLDQVLKTKFMGKNYSERIWGNTNRLAKDLKQILATAIASGQSEEKTARLFRERFGVSNYEAERLIRTESAYFANKADLQAYKDTGVEKVQFLATLDKRTSAICQHSDRKIIDLDKAKIGVNLPPLHPWCRSTTIPVIEGLEDYVVERRARDNEGNNIVTGNINYEQYVKLLNSSEQLPSARDTWKISSQIGASSLTGFIKQSTPKPTAATQADNPDYITQTLPSGLTIKVYQKGWNSAGGEVRLTDDEVDFHVEYSRFGGNISWIPEGEKYLDDNRKLKQKATNDYFNEDNELEWELKTPQGELVVRSVLGRIKKAAGNGKRIFMIYSRHEKIDENDKRIKQLSRYNQNNPDKTIDKLYLFDKEKVIKVIDN